MPWRIIKFIEHLFYFRHRKGHGIHSPYLFEFVNGILFNGAGVELPSAIQKEHDQQRAGNSFVRRSSVSVKNGFLLYRITRWFKPDMIIELGTGVGISTIYLSEGSPGTPLHSIEGNRERAVLAGELILRLSTGHVTIHQGEMEEKLDDILPMLPPRFVAFVDGNHHYEPTVAYVDRLLERAGDEAVIVMDDIYWSKGMHRAWKELAAREKVNVSLDLFHMGILLIKKELQKKKYKIKF
jgi:predicted O-methyltransferase YrrM